MMRLKSLLGSIIIAATLASIAQAAPAVAVPAPEVEYTYDVAVRRHYQFPNNDGMR
jgi:hypothetical protein